MYGYELTPTKINAKKDMNNKVKDAFYYIAIHFYLFFSFYVSIYSVSFNLFNSYPRKSWHIELKSKSIYRKLYLNDKNINISKF